MLDISYKRMSEFLGYLWEISSKLDTQAKKDIFFSLLADFEKELENVWGPPGDSKENYERLLAFFEIPGRQPIDLSHLQDGNLHLVAFLGDKFCYLVEDPHGSGWAMHDALTTKFPGLVLRMLADYAPPPGVANLTGAVSVDG